MADTDTAASTLAPAAAAAAPVKKRGPAKAKKPASHPQYKEMIVAAISQLKERGGSSRQAICKYICANFNVGHNVASVNTHLKVALKAGVTSGLLKQSKGNGATGSFRIGEKKVAVKPKTKKPKSPKKPKATAKKPAAKKAVKKPATAKKPAAKKAVKKPAAAKKPATKKPAAKKPAAKKPAAKKPASKKPAAKK